jgi:outer membrane protein
MKKTLLTLCAIVLCAMSASAQKYALIDMEYILKNIPAYEMANEQLNQVAKRWQKECEDLASEAETLYKNYQADMVFLTDEMKTQRAEEVKAKEEETKAPEVKRADPKPADNAGKVTVEDLITEMDGKK